MKKLALTAVLTVLVGLVAISVANTAEQAKETYKIGVVLDITGPASSLGEPEKQTLGMLAEELNAKGGINGHLIEMILYDNEGDEAKSLIKAKKLIEQDKVLALIGTSQSGTTMAIVPTVTAAQIPLVSCAASWKIIRDPETKKTREWVFKTPQSDSLAVTKIFDYLQKKGVKKIAIMSVSTGYGDSGRAELQRLAPNYKFEIVADERFAPTDTDMSAQLTKIKGSGAEAVICWAIRDPSAVVAKNMKQLGMKQMLIMSHGVATKKFIELAGDASEGIILPAGKLIVADLLPATDPQKKVLIDYRNKFEAKYKTPVSTFGGHAYDAFTMLTDAIKKAGPDQKKIRDELEKVKGFPGTGGIFNMGPDDHEGLTKDAFMMVTIKNGNWELVK